jgi:hypothetical protein
MTSCASATPRLPTHSWENGGSFVPAIAASLNECPHDCLGIVGQDCV